jgi:phosphopantetheine adenylyltransferase
VTEETPTSVLVVANETLVGDELVDALRRRAEKGPIRVAVVAPVTQPREGYVVYRDSRRAAAGRRLDRVLSVLRLAGIPAHGAVFDDEPLPAVKDVLASEDIDEIVVSTHPETTSGWLRKNLVDEIRKAAGGRPVEHVVSDVSARAGANVLVVSNETVLGEPLLERIRQRASEGPASFLIVCPQSDPSRSEHPEAERRLRGALSILRSEGLDVHGQIAHPDPFTAAMEQVEDERTDEIIVSTFPGERSGWLRRDLVGRLRSATNVPVQHVVVEERVEVPA